MNRATQIVAELQILQVLCDERVPRGRRLELLQANAKHVFADPEHQVVFESIERIFPSGPISAARLTVHLNNRGFPDVDISRYLPAAAADPVLEESAVQGSDLSELHKLIDT